MNQTTAPNTTFGVAVTITKRHGAFLIEIHNPVAKAAAEAAIDAATFSTFGKTKVVHTTCAGKISEAVRVGVAMAQHVGWEINPADEDDTYSARKRTQCIYGRS